MPKFTFATTSYERGFNNGYDEADTNNRVRLTREIEKKYKDLRQDLDDKASRIDEDYRKLEAFDKLCDAIRDIKEFC
jgi:hypothetical protein